MSNSAHRWLIDLDMMGFHADKADLQIMLDTAPNDIELKEHVDALKLHLSQ